MVENKTRRTKNKTRRTKNKILGIEERIEVCNKSVNYEDKDILYKITNLIQNNNPLIIKGNLVETFIGGGNQEARIQLRKGAKEVVTHDNKGQKLYKIEVID